MSTTRKAPPEKADTYDEGFTTIGCDNLKYIVKVDKNNIKRWMKMKKETIKKYTDISTQTDELFHK